MIAKVIKKSTQTIINLSEAKDHLRILHNYEDLYINTLLSVVTDSIENELDRDLVDTTYQFAIFDKLVENENILFPNAPIYNVTDVKFFNDQTEIDSSEFEFSFSDEYIKFSLLPSDYTHLQITYKKGIEDSDDLPEAIKQAAKIMLTDLYQFRGTLVIGKSVVNLHKVVQRLLQPYKNVSFL
ncbi:putative phiE125 gp8 family phage protein [Algoriphagus sp. 4150]|uniref:head-tail connector protein n=1 Tax=Algoriphagus sp. 4150 TaxID=2817756 RepID=UPI00285D4CEE|nr:head-tail connector protein [Algoriphagus sp. 4150]MDR7130692.1 putative phiE125 gp8 family phage protein [Algoriphagus sp. 4150]